MKHTQRRKHSYWDNWLDRMYESYLNRPKRGKISLRPAKMRGRPKGMSQKLWFWLTPERGYTGNKKRRPKTKQTGWSGGLDRDKPHRWFYNFYFHGKYIGGLARYSDNEEWIAYNNCPGRDNEKRFNRRCEAKRWVESFKDKV